MASVRARLTIAYAFALFSTIVVFAVVLVIARKASAYRELEEQVTVQARAVLDVIDEAEREGVPLTVRPDTLSGPVVAPQLYRRLEGIGDYVLVLDPNGRALYLSFQVQRLSDDDRVRIQQAVLQASPNGPATLVALDSDRVLLVARPDPQGEKVARIGAGVSARAAEAAPSNLAVTMLALMPLVLLLSVGGAYLISGRAFRPVERIINEVEAITDGRSLHRRLPADGDNDELGRLSNTLNAMIARLETSFGGLRRFTADASHELKTPLTVLRADVERAMNPRVGHTEQLVALEEALQETTRMADLVESLLTLARADEGRFELATERLHLESLTREVFETAVILGEDAGLDVGLPVIEDAVVMGDRTRLRQLFLNLITNAIKYTPRGGRVEVALGRRLDEATFTVRDSGIGIAAGDLPYIFDRFWRADRARSRRAATEGGAVERGGFGLGLAIAQYIAQAHGGSLTVQSRLGRGSVFMVSLPLAEDGTEETAAREQSGEAGR